MVKSSGKRVIKFEAKKKAERFLCDLANLRPTTADEAQNILRRIFPHYPEIFPGNLRDRTHFLSLVLRAETISVLLRKAWDAPDSRQRDWFLHELVAYDRKLNEAQELQEQFEDPAWLRELLGGYFEPGSPFFDRRFAKLPAETTALEEMILHFKDKAKLARRCRNEKCAGPYFFASKKGQKYCSEECATPAKRIAKRDWWRKNRGKKAH